MTERITSARELSAYLVAKFRRDGTLPEGIWVADGELILPIGPELNRLCDLAMRLRQSCDRAAKPKRCAQPMYLMTLRHSSPCSIAAMTIGSRSLKPP